MITLKKEGKYWYLNFNGREFTFTSLNAAMNFLEKKGI